MYFGMPTLVECPDVVANVQQAAQRQLDFVEINLSFPQYRSTVLTPDFLNGLKEKYGVFFTFHADEQLNPFDFDNRVSDCYFGVVRDDIRLAKAVGAPVINMHLLLGVYVTLTTGKIFLNDVYRDAYLEKVQAFITMCEKEIGDAPLKIAIENVDTAPFTESQRAALSYFLKSPVFALTFDAGHECCLGGKNLDIYELNLSRRVHMHLHDSDGKRAHLALGDGIMDVKGLLQQAPRPNTCLIEVKTLEGLDRSIAYLQQNKVWKEDETYDK